MKKLLVKNIGLLATPEGKSAHRGSEQGKIKFLKDAWVLIEDGVIASVGTGEAPAAAGAEIVDAEGKLVTPGLVDAHTHLIFGGWRQNELGMKLHGKTYLEIQNAGGGIQSTTNATRGATEEELTAKAAKALDEMMAFGTTTCEAKSGYGLATEHELKALRVIRDLDEQHPMDMVATFMGAHLVPAEYKANRAEYIRLVCEEMMPLVKEQGIAKFCDVFCEADTFTVEESRQVLEAAEAYKDVARKYIYSAPMSAAAYFALFQQIDGLLFFDLYDKNDSKAYGAVATSFDHYYPESPRAKHLYNLALQSIKVIRSQRPMDLDKVEKKEVSFLDIELPDVHGENTKLSSVATGKVVLINFTAYMSEWSPALNMEFGDLYTRYHDKGLEIYQISLDSDLHFWKNAASNLPWTCVRDPQSVYSQTAALYNVKQLPAIFILDRKGNLVKRVDDVKKLEADIKSVL